MNFKHDTNMLSVKGGQPVDALAFLDEVAVVVQREQEISKVRHLQVHLLDQLLHLTHTEGGFASLL